MNSRRLIEWVCFLFFLMVTFAASSSTWIQWLVFDILIFVVLLCDYIFFDETAFLFNPDYKTWARKAEPSEF